MIHDWDDLAYNGNPAHGKYNEIKAWLRSQTQDSETIITATSHPSDMLNAALQAAIWEIRDNLDEQIALLVDEAESVHIQVRQADYYRTRADDWDSMLPTDTDEMRTEEVVELLHAAKDEIAWLVNEISRLQCYIDVERQFQRAGEMERATVLRPLPRKRPKDKNNSEQQQGGSNTLETADSSVLAYHERAPSVELPG